MYGPGLHLKMGEQNMGPSINTYGPGLQLKPTSPTSIHMPCSFAPPERGPPLLQKVTAPSGS